MEANGNSKDAKFHRRAFTVTGGMVPDGADAVIMLEMTEEITKGNRAYVKIRKTDTRGANIIPIGEEADRGALVLRKGQVIGAGQMAILAALGYSRVEVFRKPKVAIISTGTELLRVSKSLQMGKIRNSNAYMLSAQILSAGGEPRLVDQNGKNYVKPVGLDKSSAVISIKDANCLIVIPPTKTGIRTGEIVKAIPLGGMMFP